MEWRGYAATYSTTPLGNDPRAAQRTLLPAVGCGHWTMDSGIGPDSAVAVTTECRWEDAVVGSIFTMSFELAAFGVEFCFVLEL